MMMVLKTKKCVLAIAFLIFMLIVITECKRGGGRRGGTYRGSSNVWGRAKQSHNPQASNYDQYGQGQRRSKSQSSDALPDQSKKSNVAPATPKASAPPAPSKSDTPKSSVGDSSSSFIQQEKKQQIAPQNTANAQRPIGWDVGQGTKSEGNVNKNVGWNVGSSNPAQGASGGSSYVSSNLGKQQAYPSHVGAYPNTGASNYYGTGTNYNYGSNNHHQYNPNQPPPAYYPNSPHYYNSGVGNHYGGGNNYGNPGYGGYGGYGGHGGYGGYGGNGGFGGYGGGGGFGGYGGLGGWGGNGIGGYGQRFGGGFGKGFGSNAYRNVLIGLVVWNLVSGFTRRPYYVYNYHNHPERIPEEIPLPANTIVLCPENVTSLCAPNTAPLCTSNNTILCVALAQQTVPCGDNADLKCVNSTVTCTDGTEESCDDKEKKNTTSTINIPCVTNATIIGKVMDNSTIAFSGTGTLFNQGNTTTLCVTTFALPQPEEEAKQSAGPLCDPNGSELNKNNNCTSNLTDLSESKDSVLNSTVIANSVTSTVEPLAM